jgi:hypothetical protein
MTKIFKDMYIICVKCGKHTLNAKGSLNHPYCLCCWNDNLRKKGEWKW